MARLQEEARWSSFTAAWSRSTGGGPRWVRRLIIAAIVLMVVVSVFGLIASLSQEKPAVEGVTGCPTGALCFTFSASPTVP